MTTIIEQLNKLDEIAPKACWRENGVFAIGDYHFWDSPQHGFCARHIQATMGVKGRPALAWLRDALEQVIEAREQYWELRYWKPKGKYKAEIANYTAWADSPAEALLAVLIKALGG